MHHQYLTEKKNLMKLNKMKLSIQQQLHVWRLTNFVMYTPFQVPNGDPALFLFHFWIIV